MSASEEQADDRRTERAATGFHLFDCYLIHRVDIRHDHRIRLLITRDMRQVERQPNEPWLVGILRFLLGDPFDGIGGVHYRRIGGRRDAGYGSDGRFFGTVLVGSVGAVLDMIVPIPVCGDTTMEIALVEIETGLFGFHAGVYTQARHVPLAEHRGAVAALFLQVPDEGVMVLGQPVRVIQYFRLGGIKPGENRCACGRAKRIYPGLGEPHARLGKGVEGGGGRGATLDHLIIGMIVPRRPVLLDKAVDQARIHVGCHVDADVVADDQQNVWTSRRTVAGCFWLFCRERRRSSDHQRSQYGKSIQCSYDGSMDHCFFPPRFVAIFQ